jgi:ribosomal protein S18 acetylase RimI-like enzyme
VTATSKVSARHAAPKDVEALAPLFEAYRQFYRQEADLPLARRFLRERLERSESVIFLAEDTLGVALGFTQLSPSFSSVSAERIFILNDLFVAPEARRMGVGRLLLAKAAEFIRSVGAVRLSLTTEKTNKAAHALYESAGYKQQSEYDSFDLLV